MADPTRNAAIFYTKSDFDPLSTGINGRRMASLSFLRGFIQHAEVDEFVSISLEDNSARQFNSVVRDLNTEKPIRNLSCERIDDLKNAGCVFYSSSTYGDELWRRYTVGTGAYSLCGLTHTLSTSIVLRGIYDMRAGPQQEWDGLICTSASGKAAVERQMDR